MMRLGLCCGDIFADPAVFERAASFGLDYLEAALPAIYDAPESALREVLSESRRTGVPVRAAYLFFREGSVTGPDSVTEAMLRYARTALDKAASLGVRKAVLGAGFARRLPEGMDRVEGLRRFGDFLGKLGETAQAAGVQIALEPLNRKETDLICTVAEAAEFLRAVQAPNVGLVCDLYHIFCEDEPFSEIVHAGSLVAHAHFCEPEGRQMPLPGREEYYRAFFDTLAQAGYAQREVSLECGFDDNAQLMRGVRVFRSLGV